MNRFRLRGNSLFFRIVVNNVDNFLGGICMNQSSGFLAMFGVLRFIFHHFINNSNKCIWRGSFLINDSCQTN